MRIGTFVMGGLAGAAIAMLVKRSPAMSAVCAGIGQNLMNRIGGMKENTIGKAMDFSFTGGFKKKSEEPAEASKSAVDLDEVSRLAAQDPTVKNEINEILEQSGQQQL